MTLARKEKYEWVSDTPMGEVRVEYNPASTSLVIDARLSCLGSFRQYLDMLEELTMIARNIEDLRKEARR